LGLAFSRCTPFPSDTYARCERKARVVVDDGNPLFAVASLHRSSQGFGRILDAIDRRRRQSGQQP
jgi:hypothetical protein